MYYLFGLQHNLETVAIVSRNFLNTDGSQASFAEIKRAYHKFAYHIQPCIPHLKNENIYFVDDDDTLSQLIKIFSDSSSETISGYPYEKISDKNLLNTKYDLVKNAIEKIKEVNSEFYFLFELLFKYIFSLQMDKVACATIPKALGLLLLDHKEWKVADLCEMLIHETIHQMITLDEYRHEYFVDMEMLANPDNFALSAMRATPRPLNKVLHSLIVAYEILAFRKITTADESEIKVHPKSSVILDQIKNTILSIKQLQNYESLLTERSRQIVNLIDNRIKAFH